MFDLKLTSEDKKWLLEEHPSLIIEERGWASA
jgi:hypothetical protein